MKTFNIATLLFCLAKFCNSADDSRVIVLDILQWGNVKEADVEELVISGKEPQPDGTILISYVARANIQASEAPKEIDGKQIPGTGTIPGKWNSIRGMTYGYGNTTKTTTDFDVLVAPPNVTEWDGDSASPEKNYVVGGIDPDTGKNFYLCRIVQNEGTTILPGKMTEDFECLVPLDGYELSTTTQFEVLVFTDYGEKLLAVANWNETVKVEESTVKETKDGAHLPK